MTRRTPTRGGSRRPQYANPNAEDQVEVEKLDPAAFLQPTGLRDPEAELMENAVPASQVKSAPTPTKEDEAAEPEIKPPPPPQAEDPLDRILSGSILDRLYKKFGVLGAGEDLMQDTLVAGGVEVSVHFRKPHYDDFLWGLGEIEGRIRQGVDIGLLRGDQARNSYLNHLSSCCAVVKIDDEYVWDVFGMTEGITEMSPSWDGKTLGAVPDVFRSELTAHVHDLLRNLHPDLLFALRGSILDVYPKPGGAVEGEDPAGDPEEGSEDEGPLDPS